MKTSSTFSILIWINASRAKNNEAEIFARITVNQKRANISLKRKIDIDSWNKSKGRAKGNTQEARILNQYLDQVQAKFFESYQDLRAEDKLITAEIIKARFLGEDKQYHSLQDIIDYHNSISVYKLHKDTMRHYKTTQKYLMEFVRKQYKTSDIHLKDLNYAFIISFENFLRSLQPSDLQRKIENNTTMKHIQRLRKMVTIAYHTEWIDKDPFVKFRSTIEKREREFLTDLELKSVEDYNTAIERINLVKDIFIFSCYTGIAYIDIMKLTKNNILKGIDGNQWIITKRQKTGTPLKIPILEKAQELIDKYQNSARAEVTGTLFPVLSNQKLNAYLKEIADLCNIKKNLTFHMARHTFATTITLTNGVPIETVSKLLGHSKISTTQIYANVIERKVSDDMNSLKLILNKNKEENDLKNSESAG
ncbi:MAG: site-specific integrase [Gelidibacter sp.]|nr:site-specific integrase [Gelidibacter sp.]